MEQTHKGGQKLRKESEKHSRRRRSRDHENREHITILRVRKLGPHLVPSREEKGRPLRKKKAANLLVHPPEEGG